MDYPTCSSNLTYFGIECVSFENKYEKKNFENAQKTCNDVKTLYMSEHHLQNLMLPKLLEKMVRYIYADLNY